MRPSNREADQMRELTVVHDFTKHAEGSVLVGFGDTKVLCTASVLKEVPHFLKDKNQGWLTAEYGMLPRSTHSRMGREAARGKQSGRTQEIQRLIGRALRAAIDLTQFPGYTIRVDCDVLQADGGTRTASITGACIAIRDAVSKMKEKDFLPEEAQPIKHNIAAISVGMYQGQAVLDLDYDEDSRADTDMNVVMTENGGLIEVQGTAEGEPFSEQDFQKMLFLAKKGIMEILDKV